MSCFYLSMNEKIGKINGLRIEKNSLLARFINLVKNIFLLNFDNYKKMKIYDLNGKFHDF